MARPEDNSVFWSLNVPSKDFMEEAIRQGVGTLTIFLESPNGAIPVSHPKKLKDELTNWVGQNIEISFLKVTRGGKIVCVTENNETALKLLQITELLTVPVIPKLMLDTLTTKFLLYDIPVNVTCGEIADELMNGGVPVCEVRRFQKMENGQKVSLKSVLVTKIGQMLPERVHLWFEEIRIRQFIDRPRQCGKCFQFSHATKNCRNETVCKRCGDMHEAEQCRSAALKCKNCGEAHEATNRMCKAYVKETEINRFKSEHHLTITEARRRYAQRGKTGSKQTYAKVTSVGPQVESVAAEEITAKMEKMLQRFEVTLQNFLVTQMESFSKMLEAVTVTLTNTLQKLSMPSIGSSKSGSLKREGKKLRVSHENFSEPSPGPSGKVVGGWMSRSLGTLFFLVAFLLYRPCLTSRIRTAPPLGDEFGSFWGGWGVVCFVCFWWFAFLFLLLWVGFRLCPGMSEVFVPGPPG